MATHYFVADILILKKHKFSLIFCPFLAKIFDGGFHGNGPTNRKYPWIICFEIQHKNFEIFIKIGDYACPSMLGACREWLLIVFCVKYNFCSISHRPRIEQS